MAQADTNRVSLYYSIESTWNETPSTPTMLELPFVSDTLGHKKATVVPSTIRSDRAEEDIVRVGEDASGDVNFEFRHGIYDDFIACVLGSTYTTVTIAGGTDISASTTDDSFNSAAAQNFVSSGIVAGMWIRTAGFSNAANNGLFKVLTVTTLKITVDANLTTESAGASVGITAKMVRNGTTKRSVLVEKRWNDIAQYQSFRGMRVGQMNLNLTSRQLVTGSFSLMGANGPMAGSTVAGSSSPAASRAVYDASNNVAVLSEASTTFLTPITSLQMTINGNLRMQPAVANRFPIGIGLGTLEITGNMEAYFENSTVWTKFYNHTSTNLFFRLTDAASRHILVTIPKLYFAEGDIPTQGANQDAFIPLPLRAAYDSTAGYTIQFDILG